MKLNFTEQELLDVEKSDCGCEDIDPRIVHRLTHTPNCKRHAIFKGYGRKFHPGNPYGMDVSVFELPSGRLVYDVPNDFDKIRHRVDPLIL